MLTSEPMPSTSEVEEDTDDASKDAQWASRIGEELLKSLKQKVRETESSRLGSTPSTSETERAAAENSEKDAQWATNDIAIKMARRASRRRRLGTPGPDEREVSIFHVHSRLAALYPRDLRRDDIFLGLFAMRQKQFVANARANEAFKLKLDVVDAFIATLNRREGVAETQTIPTDAGNVRLGDVPRGTTVIEIPEVKTRGEDTPSQNQHGEMKNKTSPAKDLEKKYPQVETLTGQIAESGGIWWNWDLLREHVVKNPKRARSHYAPSRVENPEEVRSLLALDSVFLCMYLLKYLVQWKYTSSRSRGSRPFSSKDFDIIFEKSPSFHNRILSDIAKLQNQIPFYLIKEVLKIYAPNLVEDHLRAICRCWIWFHHESLPGYDKGDAEILPNNLRSMEHLLACLCHLTQGKYLTRARVGQTGSLSSGHEFIKDKMSKLFSARFHKILQTSTHMEGDDLEDVSVPPALKDVSLPSALEEISLQSALEDVSLPSASTMRERGIHFQGHAEGPGNLVPKLKPRFFNLGATLYIPCVSVVPNTAMLWRNMLVYLYESRTANNPAQFIYFLLFMDELIDNEKDVEVLREGPDPVIQKSLLGTNKQVADLFNTIIPYEVIGTVSYRDSDEWHKLSSEIDQFLKQRKRVRFLEFLRDNFGTPVLIVSVIAALLLFVLSVLQTIYSALQYYNA